MKTLLWVVVVFNQLALLIIGAMQFSRYSVNEFAFNRHLSEMEKHETQLHRRIYKKLSYIIALQSAQLIVFSTTLIVLMVVLVGPLLGIVYSLISFTVLWQFSRIGPIRKQAEKLFMNTVDVRFAVISYLEPVFRILGIFSRPQTQLISSFSEFKDTLRRLPSTVLSPEQRQKLETVISSENKTVKDCMTAKKQVSTVKPSATLGPVILSDLQKTGHGYFPVVTKKGDVEGILRLSDISDITAAKKHSAVNEFITPHITWLEESATLKEAMQLFLDEKQYIILVHGETGQWSGIITIADLLKHAIGFHQQ